MSEEPPRPVTFNPPGGGAYRISVLGDERRAVSGGLSVAGEPLSVRLEPGEYTAIVESVSSPGRTTQDFTISSGTDLVEVRLNDDPDEDATSHLRSLDRPSQDMLRMLAPRLGEQLLSSARRLLTTEGADAARSLILDIRNAAGEMSASFLKGFAEGYAKSRAKDETAPAADRPPARRAFQLGISSSHSKGLWYAFKASCEFVSNMEGEVKFHLPTPPDWDPAVRRRLTVSVNEDVAWRMGVPSFREGAWIMLRPVMGLNGPDVAVTMRPACDSTATLVGALNRALPEEVDMLIGAAARTEIEVGQHGVSEAEAIKALADRDDDPWGATASALLLARTGRIASVAEAATGLAYRFPWLPDAGVAAAWAEVAIRRSDNDRNTGEQRCLQRLQASRVAGTPYFMASDVLALQMLTSLAVSKLSAVKRHAAHERELWMQRARQTVRTGAFLAWEVDHREQRNWTMLPEGYFLLMTGDVTEHGVALREVNGSSGAAASLSIPFPAMPAQNRAPSISR